MIINFYQRSERLKKQLIKALAQTARELLAPAVSGTLKFRDPISTIGPIYLAVKVYPNAKAAPEVLRTSAEVRDSWVPLEEQPLDYLLRVYDELTPRFPRLEIRRD